MRLIIQRVTSAKVEVDGEVVSEIGRGLFILVGISVGDTPADAEYLYAHLSQFQISHKPHKAHLTVVRLSLKKEKVVGNSTLGRT